MERWIDDFIVKPQWEEFTEEHLSEEEIFLCWEN